MNKFFIFAVAIMLGCGSSPILVYSVNGSDGANNWIGIKCKKGILHCYGEAGRICPNGYILMNDAAAGNKELIIKCKSSVKAPF